MRWVVAVDEINGNIDGPHVYCWASIDVSPLQFVHLDVMPGQSSLNVLLFLEIVLQRCRGKSLILVDRDPWSVAAY